MLRCVMSKFYLIFVSFICKNYFFFLQDLSREWTRQKKQLVHAFDRIIQSKAKKKQKPSKNEVFFNSDRYLILAKVVPKTSSQSTDDTTDHVPETD